MKRIKKSTYLPVLLLLFGAGFYVYNGLKWNSWRENLANMVIYFVIILALWWALRTKERYGDEREKDM